MTHTENENRHISRDFHGKKAALKPGKYGK
jgi:hypothetical protein